MWLCLREARPRAGNVCASEVNVAGSWWLKVDVRLGTNGLNECICEVCASTSAGTLGRGLLGSLTTTLVGGSNLGTGGGAGIATTGRLRTAGVGAVGGVDVSLRVSARLRFKQDSFTGLALSSCVCVRSSRCPTVMVSMLLLPMGA